MKRNPAGLWVVLLVGLAACGKGGEEQASAVPREEALRAARADSVARATEMYDASVFDTLTWESDNARWERGGVVWAFTCQRCHGASGDGQGEDAVKFNIEVPDMTVADWPYANDIPAIRERIYVGHDSEMPSMGLIGLTYRDVDASAYYINDLLRSDQ